MVAVTRRASAGVPNRFCSDTLAFKSCGVTQPSMLSRLKRALIFKRSGMNSCTFTVTEPNWLSRWPSFTM